MTASEVIEEIKRLPPQDKEIVQRFVRQMESATGVEYLSDQAVLNASEEIFRKHQSLFQKLAQ